MRVLGRSILPILLCLALFGSRGAVAAHVVSLSAHVLSHCAGGQGKSIPHDESEDCDDCCEVSEILLSGDFLINDSASSIPPSVFWRVARRVASPSGDRRSAFLVDANRARAPPVA
jgi:hypothetical protein